MSESTDEHTIADAYEVIMQLKQRLDVAEELILRINALPDCSAISFRATKFKSSRIRLAIPTNHYPDIWDTFDGETIQECFAAVDKG